MDHSPRRAFLRQAAVLGAAFSILSQGFLRASSSIRIGIIGCGQWGRDCLGHALRHPGVQVRALCEPDAVQRALALSSCSFSSPSLCTHWQQLVQRKDIDAVLIATPWQWHGVMALAALRAGKHVLCGPVAATTPQGHDALALASLQHGRQYITLNETDFHEDQQALQQMVKTGLFGDILQIHTGVHCAQLPGHRYALQGASSAVSMLGVDTANPFVQLSLRKETMEYITQRVGRKGQPYLVHQHGRLPVLEATTASGQSLKLQAGHMGQSPVAIGFRLQGSKGQWLESGRVLQRTEMLACHQWEAGRPYLEAHKPISSLPASALAFDHAIASLKTGGPTADALYQTLAMSRLQSFARKTLRSPDATLQLPAWIRD
ncbi:Predicted dehydrogenase [Chitinophaga costaii]|uniref:Predicted dehydrogenase n=1 Tax=Chitinophaga costaii TaxID=1335309 RepID=A0A1C4E0M8_9BACT|nr:Gfo/Idh/MocA family oxidoreductase [Chitinophaga costaii]PUZ24391.1 gfo/Idh/MocA family oxidoreductase [Chitinophaga costaii]SCC37065.1 Predicted dehydrogenase [Chitinophaga costaii]